MTGHQHHNQSHGTNPLRRIETPDLNTQAARLATARTEGNPLIRDLETIEPRFIAELLRRLDNVDHAQIGAILLTAGELASQVLALIDEAHRPNGGPILTNLLQLAGQQLYHGKMRHIAACPYPLATGKPCAHVARAETEDQFDAVMRGHIDLHHPRQQWPVAEPEPKDQVFEHTTTFEDLGLPAPTPHPESWREITPTEPTAIQHGRQYERDEPAPEG